MKKTILPLLLIVIFGTLANAQKLSFGAGAALHWTVNDDGLTTDSYGAAANITYHAGNFAIMAGFESKTRTYDHSALNAGIGYLLTKGKVGFTPYVCYQYITGETPCHSLIGFGAQIEWKFAKNVSLCGDIRRVPPMNRNNGYYSYFSYSPTPGTKTTASISIRFNI